MEEPKIQKILIEYLISQKYKVYSGNGYIYAEGDLPICLLAHVDTVFNIKPYDFYFDKQRGVLFAPDTGLGADDRAGIYAILTIINSGFKPSVIFTDGEERGGLGAKALVGALPHCPFKECKALIQLDRQGKNDCVFYDCDNEKFEKLINTYGFKTDIGSFTDISVIAPAWGIAAVNLSVGYYWEHTRAEYLNIYELDKTIMRLEKMLKDCSKWANYEYIPFDYSKIAKKYGYKNWDYPFLEDDKEWYNQDTCAVCGKKMAQDEGKFIATYGGYELYCDKCINELGGENLTDVKAFNESPRED